MQVVFLREVYLANGKRADNFTRWFRQHKTKLQWYRQVNCFKNASGAALVDYIVMADELPLLKLDYCEKTLDYDYVEHTLSETL